MYMYTSTSPFNQLSMSDYMSEGRAIAPLVTMDQIEALIGNLSSFGTVYDNPSAQNISLASSVSRGPDQTT